MTGRELSTVLAALRYWQSNRIEDACKDRTNSKRLPKRADEPLDSAEIDDLCKRLNTGKI